MIKAIKSKLYGQQYNQSKVGGDYIVISIYAKTRNLSKKPNIQDVYMGR